VNRINSQVIAMYNFPHIDKHKYLLNKVAKYFYCIRYLVRVGMRENDIRTVYCSIIRRFLEYASPVWHPGLTKKLSIRYKILNEFRSIV